MGGKTQGYLEKGGGEGESWGRRELGKEGGREGGREVGKEGGREGGR